MRPREKSNKRWWLWAIGIVAVLACAVGLAIWLAHDSDPPGSDPSPGYTSPSGIVLPEDTSPAPSTEGSGIKPGEAFRPDGLPVQPDGPEVDIQSAQISCDRYSRYSGPYVEDGRDQLVENVASILVTNKSDRFLEMATITYQIDGKQAVFIATGLPAGHSAWVLEATMLQVAAEAEFEYVSVSTGFLDGVTASADEVTVTAEGDHLTAVNNTSATLKDVCVYYKVRHSDGLFLGGITYVVRFGDLEPGDPLEKLAGHFSDDAQIVRISWE